MGVHGWLHGPTERRKVWEKSFGFSTLRIPHSVGCTNIEIARHVVRWQKYIETGSIYKNWFVYMPST